MSSILLKVATLAMLNYQCCRLSLIACLQCSSLLTTLNIVGSKKLFNNKQLLDEVFVICRIIIVEVRVISQAESEADNSYQNIDNFAYHKNRIR